MLSGLEGIRIFRMETPEMDIPVSWSYRLTPDWVQEHFSKHTPQTDFYIIFSMSLNSGSPNVLFSDCANHEILEKFLSQNEIPIEDKITGQMNLLMHHRGEYEVRMLYFGKPLLSDSDQNTTILYDLISKISSKMLFGRRVTIDWFDGNANSHGFDYDPLTRQLVQSNFPLNEIL